MKVSSFKKVIPEDFPSENRELIDKLAQVINPLLESYAQFAANNCTIKDNFKGSISTNTLESGVSSCKVSWKLNELPTACLVVRTHKVSNGGQLDLVATTVGVTWRYNNGLIEMTFLGLDAASKHQISTLIFV